MNILKTLKIKTGRGQTQSWIQIGSSLQSQGKYLLQGRFT